MTVEHPTKKTPAASRGFGTLRRSVPTSAKSAVQSEGAADATREDLLQEALALRTQELRREIEERMRSESARSRLAAIVECSDDAIIGTSLDGAITTWNSGAERIFGWSAREMIGTPVRMLIPPEERDKERLTMERVGRGEILDQFDTVRLARDARRLRLSVRFSAVRDGSGAVVGTSKIAREITPQMQAERDLARFFTLSPQMLCVADFDGNFVRLNPAWEMTLGFPQGELLAQPLAHFVHPEDRAATIALL
jgi:PAS domain S-box-containing protein